MISRRLLAAALCIRGIIAARTVQEPHPWEVEAGLSYTDPSGASVRVEGVCRYSPDSLSCWDPDGRPNPELEKKLRDHYAADRFPNLRFRIQQKNRLVVLATQRDQSRLDVVEGGERDWGTSLQWPNKDQVDYPFCIARRESDTQATLIAVLNDVPFLKTCNLSFAPGSSAQFEGSTVTFGMTAPGGVPWSYDEVDFLAHHYPNGFVLQRQTYGYKEWTYRLHFDRLPVTYWATYGFAALDHLGKPIAYVDASGKPTDPPVSDNPADFYSRKGKETLYRFETAFVKFQYLEGTTAVLTSNVSPVFLGSANVTGSHDIRARLTGIPLDPSGPQRSPG